MYRVEVSSAADRDLGKLKGRMQKQDFERLREAVRGLAEEPRPHGVRRIKGADRAYRIRLGDFRIVYEVHDADHLVVLLQISRRTEATYRR
jgi:mRNA interferase RelE/StbE